MRKAFKSVGACWLWVVLAIVSNAEAAQWSVPLAGNAFTIEPVPGKLNIDNDGRLRWNDSEQKVAVFFRVDRPCTINLAVNGRAGDGNIQLQASVGNIHLQTQLQHKPQQPAEETFALGEVLVEQAGYVKVVLNCIPRLVPRAAAELTQLLVSSPTAGLKLDFVRDNSGNMFYWGRRGPSVHWAYRMPAGVDCSYAYSEITVPQGQDSIGAYFMANGFSEGYFGMQVNSDSERRVLFSVWSPFATDNPDDIPAEDRVQTLAKGADVHAQDFGNEGAGGQSFLVYPWKAGVTYQFLTEVKPTGDGSTLYTSWFGDKPSGEWRLIASFRRPKTDHHLRGFHSFLENFDPELGYLERSAEYGNQWVRDVDQQWHEVTEATLTGDNTARSRSRLDYSGGTAANRFVLKHCGFFAEPVELDQRFTRTSSPDQQPQIDFETLPRK